ncbi:MAG: hypothetical protein QOH97_1005 [Actinoplanes sp.]|nr:hypothetical protein [Actinoplanes sp.]
MLQAVQLRPPLSRVRQLTATMTGFYTDRSSRGSLLASALMLCYGGGIVMFVVHYVIRRECGPAINAGWHWLLDSTIGFVALTPLLAVLLPAAAMILHRRTGTPPTRPAVGPYSVLVGAVFAVATAPGPFVHNLIAGAGRPLAQLATVVFGEDQAALAHNAHAVEHSAVSEGIVQLAVGLPLYVAFTYVAISMVRSVAVGLDRPGSTEGQPPAAATVTVRA